MSAELAPCPFCGGHPVTTEAMGEHWISCGTCTASATMKGKLKAACDAWNRRTPPAMSADHIGDATNMVAPSAHLAPIKPSDDTGELRERVAQIIEAAIERHNPGNSLRHTIDDADAILDLIQSERAG